MRLGLVVNPIAGMGGRVALKGSDDPELVAAARARGAEPVAPARAIEALRTLAAAGDGLVLLASPGEMGEREAREAGLDVQVLGTIGPVTTAADTRAAASAMADAGVELLLFAGGDGTAVDVLEAIGDRLPVVGVPAGVKMHSAVFAVNPRSAGEIAVRFAEGAARGVRQAEVMDVDEALLREGAVSAKLYGYMSVPAGRRLLQGAKARSLAGDEVAQAEIAHHLADSVLGGETWFVGPGRRRRPCSTFSGSRRPSWASTSFAPASCSPPMPTSERCSSSPRRGRRASSSLRSEARGFCSVAETSSSRQR